MESNDLVLQGLLESIGKLVHKFENEAVALLSLLRGRARSANASKDIANHFSAIIAWLAIERENPTAIETLRDALSDPIAYSGEIRRTSFEVGSMIVGAKGTQGKAEINATKWLCRIIDSIELGVANSVNQRSESIDDSQLGDLFKSLDIIVTRLWIAQKGIGRAESEHFYKLTKPVLERVLAFAATQASGGLAAPTAHHVIEFLSHFLWVDPSGILRMAWLTVDCSQDYKIDSMAISEIVKMVEIILADHRDQIRDPNSLQYLLNLLDKFAQTGWPEALRQVWRLDEVFG